MIFSKVLNKILDFHPCTTSNETLTQEIWDWAHNFTLSTRAQLFWCRCSKSPPWETLEMLDTEIVALAGVRRDSLFSCFLLHQSPSQAISIVKQGCFSVHILNPIHKQEERRESTTLPKKEKEQCFPSLDTQYNHLGTFQSVLIFRLNPSRLRLGWMNH